MVAYPKTSVWILKYYEEYMQLSHFNGAFTVLMGTPTQVGLLTCHWSNVENSSRFVFVLCKTPACGWQIPTLSFNSLHHVTRIFNVRKHFQTPVVATDY